MWLFETGGRRTRGRVEGIVRAVESNTSGDAIKTGHAAHPVGNRMIGAGGIAADTEPPDDLPSLIKRQSATEGDDAAGDETDAEAFLLEQWIKGVGVIQAIQ
jgi:hypothetical protein